MTKTEAMKIAAEAMVDVRTVQRWSHGEEMRTLTRERIEAAVKLLGLTVKPAKRAPK